MTQADLARKLIDEYGYSVTEAHEAVTQGDLPPEMR